MSLYATPGQLADWRLHQAALNGDEEAVLTLLKNGVDVNGLDVLQETPLHKAAEMGYENIVKILLKYGGKTDVLTKTKQTPFDLAVGNGHHSVAQILILSNNSRDSLEMINTDQKSQWEQFYNGNFIFAGVLIDNEYFKF